MQKKSIVLNLKDTIFIIWVANLMWFNIKLFEFYDPL